MLVTRWGDICSQDKRVCLSDRDLVYLLDTRREQRSTRNWRRLFPSVLFTCAESGLKEHQNWSLTPVEQLAVAMERSFLRKTSSFSELDIPKIPAGPATGGEDVSENLHNRRDPNSRLYLSAKEISPFLEIQP
ncbi:uncharacterized protein LOC101848448 isoform X1 [Aplysia californica]|uniref:Uncharacterized protein LOC101848448 isoform X1 n=1 Tax=Aplysia californica TaxID=6500 RepID=A0ABM0JXF8_APLCA|nr:uncharacterized protein LOC101848448 isoform X1 [Aplysia californica]XP_035827073.1 uncharacterized protein LOC101848448 isoform X1 [Aplysia californica]